MLTGLTPPEVNQGATFDGPFIDNEQTAQALDLDYSPVTNKALNYPTIAETTISGHQHFIVVLANGDQLDPWTGKKTNGYIIKSWRNASPKGLGMNEETVRSLLDGMYDVFGWDKAEMWTEARKQALRDNPHAEGHNLAVATWNNLLKRVGGKVEELKK
jgi:hypothetical protein